MLTPIVLMTALSLSLVAGYYSIVGLATIFASAVIPVIIMGTVLEVGKLVTTVFLHQSWKELGWQLKSYLTVAVFVLMFITSMGIFGFLSKAHLEQTIRSGGNNELRIENLERRIANEQSKIKDAQIVLGQLDQTVQTLMDYDRIRGKEGAIAVRKDQAEERASLNETIDTSVAAIEGLQKELFPLQKEVLELEVEVGPLKYIAELIYGEEAKSHFDEAVRWVILLLISVFDPLAVSLLLAWSWLVKKEEESWEQLEQKPEVVEKIVEVPVEKVVEKIVTKEVPVEVVKEVPVEKVVVKEVIKEVPVPQQEVDMTYFDGVNVAGQNRKDENKKHRLEQGQPKKK